VGYRFGFPDGSALGIATDLGVAGDGAVEALRGCALLGLESNHDPDMLRAGPYPAFLKRRILSDRGHLSNAQAADLLGRLAHPGLRQVFLLHLSKVNNRPPLAAAVLGEKLRSLGLGAGLAVVGPDQPLEYPARNRADAPRPQLELFA